MSDVVVDSSVVAKWVLPEPDSTQAQELLAQVATKGGGLLVVLDLALAEVANAIWKRHHQRLASSAEVRQFLDLLLRSPVHVEAAGPLLTAALDIAIGYDSSIYDSLFVALAQKLQLAAVTADELLFRAMHADFPQIVLLRDWRP